MRSKADDAVLRLLTKLKKKNIHEAFTGDNQHD
jgi:hypothetical protein